MGEELNIITTPPPNWLPQQAPLAMPTQSFAHWHGPRPLPLSSSATIFARFFVFSVTFLLTIIGTWQIYEMISPAHTTELQIVFAALFAITFSWIAFACASACLGFIILLRKPPPKNQDLIPPQKLAGRTALLMPIYNEDPDQVFSNLHQMGQALRAAGHADHFDIFVLSDTIDLAHAQLETEAFRHLSAKLSTAMGVYYRRRDNNHHRKAGNIADFVTRWGAAYDHMIILDADSTMTVQALLSLVRTMNADPQAGIIQSLPFLRDGITPYARMMQFCSRVYGPVIAQGLSAWHGRDGNYWGHNAIIRTKAFAEAAGLPELTGRKPFGGHILSHDFIEAALLRRAGWAVYMLPTLAGSYEQSPPTLDDLAQRDRRWAQGNLQHTKLLLARGFYWTNRQHLAQGIMSYLASPLWFLMLITGLSLSTIARYTTPNYFPEGFSLFPAWPVFNTQYALWLFSFTMIVLHLPKFFGLFLALINPNVRRGSGGVSGLLKSFLCETILSALLSPIMMLIQSRFIAEILTGHDSGWKSQNRKGNSISLSESLKHYRSHIAIGLGLCLLSLSISWSVFAWFSPIFLSLILSGLIAWFTAQVPYGIALYRANIFRIPEENYD